MTNTFSWLLFFSLTTVKFPDFPAFPGKWPPSI